MKKIPGLINFLVILVSLVIGGIILIIILRLERGFLGLILGAASLALFVYWVREFKKIINDDKQFPSLSNQKKWQYDIFENDNEITIVAEVPGPEKEILIDIINKTVKISNENFSEEIKLKKEVSIIEKSYLNGILNLKLKKEG
jgi:HSP20 family molecular chaperone IbpA|tara:strand:+ start:1592 stop:2023 length:432 start_codon:yes stop_codon:yes gene_type:complete